MQVWILPGEAAPFLVAAVRAHGSDGFSHGQAGLSEASREAVGRRLLSLIFGRQGDHVLPDVSAELARTRQALDELEHLAFAAFKADPALASEAAAVFSELNDHLYRLVSECFPAE